jgi:hypothetical protein
MDIKVHNICTTTEKKGKCHPFLLTYHTIATTVSRLLTKLIKEAYASVQGAGKCRKTS